MRMLAYITRAYSVIQSCHCTRLAVSSESLSDIEKSFYRVSVLDKVFQETFRHPPPLLSPPRRDLALEMDLRTIDLDSQLKTTLIRLCRAHGLPHSGLKSLLLQRLHARRAELNQAASLPPAATIDAVTPAATTAAVAIDTSPPAPAIGNQQLTAPPQVSLAPPQSAPPTSVIPPAITDNAFAQQIAQIAAQQAVAQVLSCLSQPNPTGTASTNLTLATSVSPPTVFSSPGLVPSLLPPSLGTSQPHLTTTPVSTTGTAVSWVYQPPAATAQQLQDAQTSLGSLLTALPPPCSLAQPHLPSPPLSSAPLALPHSSLPVAAPISGSIPAIPQRFASAAAAGEFVDFNELLYALEADGTDEPPVCLQLGDDHRLSLPRRPKKKPISTFPDWVRCYTVYSHHLSSHHPLRGPDLIAYLHIIATCNMEYNFTACLAYDTAFRKKAARFHLPTWGQIDPQLYARAFTGAGKSRAHAVCEHCLSPSHSSADCTLFYPRGPAKRPRVTTAGPKPSATQTREICRNFNRGRCSRDDCTRRHVCLNPGCTGSHPITSCPHRRASPRKS